jgi:hypothetical protein
MFGESPRRGPKITGIVDGHIYQWSRPLVAQPYSLKALTT